MKNKFFRRAAVLTAALFSFTCMSATAYAQSNEPVAETEPPAAEETTTKPFTPDGTGAVVDNATDEDGKEFFTITTPSENVFYLVIDRNAKGQQTVHFMNLVDEADLLTLMEEEDAEAYTAEKEAVAQAELERKLAEEEAAASGAEQPKENKITKYAAAFLSVLALVGLTAGSGIYAFMKQKQKKQAEKEALDPDAGYTEDKGDFAIPVEDEPEESGEEEDNEPI